MLSMYLNLEKSFAMIRVLLVCTGNICRSPMAEGLLRKMIREQNLHSEVVVESAGTFPLDGSPASAHAVETAKENGIDIRGHAARELSSRLVSRADLILTMEPEHKERLVAAFPGAEAKTHLLSLYGNPDGEPVSVTDPISLGREAYQLAFCQIEEGLKAALPKIIAMVPKGTGSTDKG